MIKLDPYLNFAGTTEEAFAFYKRVFKSEYSAFMRFGDMPASEKMSKEDRNNVMHVALPIGEHSVLLGTDVMKSPNQSLVQGENFLIRVSLDNKSEAVRIFDALNEGGQVIIPLTNEPWSELFGMCRDKFGIQWMINFDSPDK